MHMKVMKEQFVLDGDKLTHTPTGATLRSGWATRTSWLASKAALN